MKADLRWTVQAIILCLLLPATLIWVRGNAPGHPVSLALKLITFTAAAIALNTFAYEAAIARWKRRVGAVHDFVLAMSDRHAELSEDGPVEIQRLARALKNRAAEMRRIADRTKQEALRREAILACMAEGVLAVDTDLRVIFCNDAFASFFGTRPESAHGRILYEVVREPALRDVLKKTLDTALPYQELLRLPMAGSRIFEAHVLPLNEESGQGAVVALHDVTDIQRQEQVRKDFVADVSHELRTPLTAIRGYAETLLDGALEDPRISRRFVEIILSHAVRLGDIASDLLVLSDLDSNADPIELQRVSVFEVVQSAMTSVEKSAATRNVSLRVSGCEDCFILGLRFRLEQVLVNLLDNSVKFNREGGEVIVTCERRDQNVVISVSDTGIGIPSGDLRRIFERFYRVDKSRSRSVGGTGLGLPIVKEVVERMGGTVAVESTLGRGSKFIVSLKGAD